MEQKLLFPEILEALETRTLNATTIGGVVDWIVREIGLTEWDVYIMFREEILDFVGVCK